MATYAELLDAYEENADYDEVGSAAKCRTFITTVRRLLSPGVSPKRSVHGGRGSEEIELDLEILASQLEAAQVWLQANSATQGASVNHIDFTNFRE